VGIAAVGRADAAIVSTLAGSGKGGFADGLGHDASFLAPVGVAWDASGRLYVADSAAQRIRVVLPNGTVRTIAGGGGPSASRIWVNGGYADGDGEAARFNTPMGIAVGPDGDVYVADSRNRSIRLVTPEGHVTTYAGSPARPGDVDGARAVASFGLPVGIAVDNHGVAYVADTETGVRIIARDGTVSTLPVSIKGPLAVAVSPPNVSPTLWVTNREGLWRIDLVAVGKGDAAHAVARFSSGSYPYPAPPDPPGIFRLAAHGQRPIGFPYAVSMIDAVGLVYTDVVSHTVRYANHQTQDVQPIGGQTIDDAAKSGGGFKDGPSEQSRFDSPMGIAARPDGVIAVADTGNKRIRLIRDIDRAQPFYPFAGALPNVHFAPGDYRIALVGPSMIWGDGPFSESVGGRIEAALSRNASLAALHKHVRVMPVRMGSDYDAMRSYVELLADAQFVDAVVVQLSAYTIIDSYGIADDHAIIAQAPTWQPHLTSDLAGLQQTLDRAHIPVLFVIHPLGTEMGLDEMTLPEMEGLEVIVPPDGTVERAETAPFVAAHVNWLNAWPIFFADVRSPAHRPGFLSIDGHFTTYGNALLGNAIAARLAADRPWSRR